MLKIFPRYLFGKGGLILLSLILTIGLQNDLTKLIISTIIVSILWPVLEYKFHSDMHYIKFSPFYYTHKKHHDNPTPESGLPPYVVILLYYIVPICFYYYSFDWGLAISGAILLWLNLYEFIHFLCHCDYKPKTRRGWFIRTNHLKHHNFDEKQYLELLFPNKRR